MINTTENNERITPQIPEGPFYARLTAETVEHIARAVKTHLTGDAIPHPPVDKYRHKDGSINLAALEESSTFRQAFRQNLATLTQETVDKAEYDPETIRRVSEELAAKTPIPERTLGVKADMVDRPPHYNQHPGGIEAIDVLEEIPNYNLASAMKYLWRVAFGGKWDSDEDLSKALWFIKREQQRRAK